MRTVAGLFEDHQQADRAIDLLRGRGFSNDEISVVAREQSISQQRTAGSTTTDESIGASKIAGIGGGAALGGLVGMLVGLGALAIPGVGPVIAAGTLAGALGSTAVGAGIGATAGGLIGALDDAGFERHESEMLAEGVKRGGILVTVRAEDQRALEAQDLLQQAGAIDLHIRRSEWQQSGWQSFDGTSEPGADYPTFSSSSRTSGRIDNR